MDGKDARAHQAANYVTFLAWLRANAGRIRPVGNTTAVFFAGHSVSFGALQRADAGNEPKEYGVVLGYMSDYVAKMNELALKQGRPPKFSTIEEALARITAVPRLVDPQTGKTVAAGANGMDFAKALTYGGGPAFLSDKCAKSVWRRISRCWARNTEGEIFILDGLADNLGKIGKDKILIDVELKELMRNKKLSDSARRQALHFYERYIAPLDALARNVESKAQKSAGKLRKLAKNGRR